MKKIEDISEIKAIQLDILLALHDFCEKNCISYSLAAGTLIGAVRHKGFIPWDDDIDIYLLRDDYNRLINEFPEVYKGHICINSLGRNKKWNRPYAKAYDNRTIEKEDVTYNVDGMGVGIDVFPLDDVPDNHQEWIKFNRKRCRLTNLFMLRGLRLEGRRSVAKNGIILLLKIFTCFISTRCFAKYLDKFIQKHNGKGYEHVYECCWALRFTDKNVSKQDFATYIDVEFEGHKLKAMAGYDHYLTNIFGDYMQLPPEEQRTPHHRFNAYWK